MDVRQLKQILDLLPENAPVLMEDHHGDRHNIANPKITAEITGKKDATPVLILSEDYNCQKIIGYKLTAH